MLARADGALFARIATAHTPWLDRAVPLLSRSADHSALWIAVAAGLAARRGDAGRRAAVRGLGSTAATSLLVNQVIKRAVRRPRPELRHVPVVRRLKTAPTTTSFPSGHAASAAAFATGAAVELPHAAKPLSALAVAVGLSRVYVGVHYPLDVVVGAAVGMGMATLSRVVPSPWNTRSPCRTRGRPGLIRSRSRTRCRRTRPSRRSRSPRRSPRRATGGRRPSAPGP
jgi:membrane-associated phospholipid phosphatase